MLVYRNTEVAGYFAPSERRLKKEGGAVTCPRPQKRGKKRDSILRCFIGFYFFFFCTLLFLTHIYWIKYGRKGGKNMLQRGEYAGKFIPLFYCFFSTFSFFFGYFPFWPQNYRYCACTDIVKNTLFLKKIYINKIKCILHRKMRRKISNIRHHLSTLFPLLLDKNQL